MQRTAGAVLIGNIRRRTPSARRLHAPDGFFNDLGPSGNGGVTRTVAGWRQSGRLGYAARLVDADSTRAAGLQALACSATLPGFWLRDDESRPRRTQAKWHDLHDWDCHPERCQYEQDQRDDDEQTTRRERHENPLWVLLLSLATISPPDRLSRSLNLMDQRVQVKRFGDQVAEASGLGNTEVVRMRREEDDGRQGRHGGPRRPC